MRDIRRAIIPTLVLPGLALILAPGCGGKKDEYAHQLLHAIDQGKVMGTRGTMETFGTALNAYMVDRGGYPAVATIQEAAAALTPAFLRSPVTLDAWGFTLDYRSDGGSYTLTSPGADGRLGTEDDVVLVDGRFTRLPSASPGSGVPGRQ